MPILGVTGRNAAATGYKGTATYATLTTAAPTNNTPGTEVTGITRQAATWGAVSASQCTASPPAFSVPSGQTVGGVQFMDAATVGNFVDGVGVSSQSFASAGTYTVTATLTIT